MMAIGKDKFTVCAEAMSILSHAIQSFVTLTQKDIAIFLKNCFFSINYLHKIAFFIISEKKLVMQFSLKLFIVIFHVHHGPWRYRNTTHMCTWKLSYLIVRPTIQQPKPSQYSFVVLHVRQQLPTNNSSSSFCCQLPVSRTIDKNPVEVKMYQPVAGV